MQRDLGSPLGPGGFLSTTIEVGTIISSAMSGRLLKLYGAGKVRVVSVLMSAVVPCELQFSPSIVWLIVCAVPLGLGAGAVDTGLNDYVAIHYKARHMSWLHCFWGVGATLGPIIMAQFISGDSSWRNGYFVISLIQFALV